MATLIIIRGNSGSGKSTIAARLHERIVGSVLIEQDYYIKYMSPDARQDTLRKERIFADVRQALGQSEVVILEGVFDSRRYREHLDELFDYHHGNTVVTYLDVSFDETLRRHQQRDKKDQFGETEMRGWYVAHDSLGCDGEVILDEVCSENAILDSIMLRARYGKFASVSSSS